MKKQPATSRFFHAKSSAYDPEVGIDTTTQSSPGNAQNEAKLALEAALKPAVHRLKRLDGQVTYHPETDKLTLSYTLNDTLYLERFDTQAAFQKHLKTEFAQMAKQAYPDIDIWVLPLYIDPEQNEAAQDMFCYFDGDKVEVLGNWQEHTAKFHLYEKLTNQAKYSRACDIELTDTKQTLSVCDAAVSKDVDYRSEYRFIETTDKKSAKYHIQCQKIRAIGAKQFTAEQDPNYGKWTAQDIVKNVVLIALVMGGAYYLAWFFRPEVMRYFNLRMSTGNNGLPDVAASSTPDVAADGMCTPDTIVYADTSGDVLRPSIAAFPNGKLILVSDSSTIDGDNHGVIAQALLSDLTAVDTAKQVNVYTADYQGAADVVTFGNDTFIDAHNTEGQDGDSTGMVMRVGTVVGGATTLVGPEYPLFNYTMDAQEYPSLSVIPDPTENLVVAVGESNWQDGWLDGLFARVFKLDAVTKNLSHLNFDAFRVSSTNVGNQILGAVLGMPGRKIAIALYSDPENDGSYSTYFQQLTVDVDNKILSRDFSDVFVGNTDTNLENDNAKLALIFEEGHYRITYMKWDGPTEGFNIYTATVTTSGTPSTPELVNTGYKNGNQMHPAMANNGQYTLIVWDSDGEDGFGKGIVGQLYQNGAAVGDRILFNCDITNDQSWPTVAVSNGNFIVGWQSDGVGIAATVYTPPTSFDKFDVTNLFQQVTYTQNMPYDFKDMVITSPSATDTSEIKELNPAAGDLTAETSGEAQHTFNDGSGLMSITGPSQDASQVLASMKYVPSPDFKEDFVITTRFVSGSGEIKTGQIDMYGKRQITPLLVISIVGASLATVFYTGKGTYWLHEKRKARKLKKAKGKEPVPQGTESGDLGPSEIHAEAGQGSALNWDDWRSARAQQSDAELISERAASSATATEIDVGEVLEGAAIVAESVAAIGLHP